MVWWRSRRDRGGMRRRVDLTIEMPTPSTLFYVFGYLTMTALVLDARILTLLVPFAFLGACNIRLSAPKLAKVETESAIPETPVQTATGSLHYMTPPSSHRSRKLFHIPDDDEVEGPLTHRANPTSLLPTPPPTLPRRRYLSYQPQTPPVPRTERPSFRTRVSSTPSDEIRRARKGSTHRRYASENYDENLVPKKEVWDTSFELLLYNLSKSRSSKSSSPVQSQSRFNVSSPISPLAPSPLIHSS